MKRIVMAGLALFVVAGLVLAGWYYRPWSPYSPAQIAALDNPSEYPQTFQRMDEFLPSRTITASGSEELPENPQPLAVSYQWQGESHDLDSYLQAASATSLLVMVDGVIVSEFYMEGASQQTRHTSWSVGKSYVATLIAMAMEEGRIGSLDDSVAQYAPQFEGSAYGETSLRHLLMMSAGVEFNEDYNENGESDIRPFFFNAFVLGRNPDTAAARIERNREPGEDLHYVSPNSHVLSAVIRGVYGQSLAAIVQEKIWQALGMTSNASWLQNIPR